MKNPTLGKKEDILLHLSAIVRHARALRALAVRDHNRRSCAHIGTRAKKMIVTLSRAV